MNILLWVLQVLVAFVTASGAAWRISNYSQAAQDIPSVQALPHGAWIAIGAFEIACALGLVFGHFSKMKPSLTAIAASCLAVEMLLITALHLKYFGFQFVPTNPAMWSGALAILAALIAYGRFSLKPL